MDAPWALLLGVLVAGLHFHSEIWAAYVEAEGGEGALGDAVLHSPLGIERLVDVIGDCPILLPCAGVKMVRTKGAQNSLRIRAWHDNKLDDDTALGAFERDPCIACGKITSPCQLCSMCLFHAHNDCTHRFAKRDSGDDGAEVWDHNAWTGRTNGSWWRCRLNWRRELPRTQRLSCLSKRRGSLLAWRQVGARRDEHAKVCSLCWPLL